jgi:hypothetical protein
MIEIGTGKGNVTLAKFTGQIPRSFEKLVGLAAEIA